MPDIPRLVTVDLAQKKLFVDGAEFPWYITDQGVTIGKTASGDLGKVALTFYAEKVEIIPEDGQEGAEKSQVAP
jgi:hypothetical protein